jgi:hypothetical protein
MSLTRLSPDAVADKADSTKKLPVQKRYYNTLASEINKKDGRRGQSRFPFFTA